MLLCIAIISVVHFDIDTNQLIAKLPAYHQSVPHYISIHTTKPLALSASSTEAVLWNTEDWQRIRVLAGSTDGVQQVSFSPDGVSIIAAFTDGSIFFWTIDTFSLLWKISLEQLAGPSSEALTDMTKYLKAPRLSHFAVSADGEFFVYCGLSSTIYVWNLFEKRLLHEVLIPSFKDKIIIQIAFLGNKNGVL